MLWRKTYAQTAVRKDRKTRMRAKESLMVGERLFLGVGVIEWWRAAKQVRRSIHKQESINEEKKQRGRRAVVDSGRGGLVHPSSSPFVGVFILCMILAAIITYTEGACRKPSKRASRGK